MTKKRIFILGGIALLIVAFFAYRMYSQGQAARAAQANLQTAAVERGTLIAQIGASGTVRSNQSAQLAWQTSGSVGEVNVKLGDQVTSDQELASLQQTSLPQNVILAQADLVSAQKALDDLVSSGLQQAQALQAVEDAQKALDDLSQSGLTQAEAEKALADAQKAVEEAQRGARNSQSPASQSFIDEAEAQVVIAKDKMDRAWEKYEPYANRPQDNLTRANLLSVYAAAKQEYEAAVRNLNSLQGTAGPTDQAIAQANLEQAEAQLAEAQRNWERLKDGPSQAEIALAEATLADAQREWERLKDGPNPDDVAAAQARVAAAEAALSQAHITAPFDGVITQVTSLFGDQVSPGTPAFRLDDLSRLLVDVQVSEVDINQVQVGQDVLLTFDSILDKEYHGKVIEVASVGQADQGVVNFIVTVELADADEQVKPGMTAAATITVSELNDILLIPNRAVRTLDGERVVYVMLNGSPVPVPLTLGRSSDTQSEVLESDLQEGDLIVLNPPTDFSQFGPGGQGGPGGGGPFNRRGSP
jgi:HlyD family secretion protein